MPLALLRHPEDLYPSFPTGGTPALLHIKSRNPKTKHMTSPSREHRLLNPEETNAPLITKPYGTDPFGNSARTQNSVIAKSYARTVAVTEQLLERQENMITSAFPTLQERFRFIEQTLKLMFRSLPNSDAQFANNPYLQEETQAPTPLERVPPPNHIWWLPGISV